MYVFFNAFSLSNFGKKCTLQVQGKTVDQITDMMVANANNLIVTIKPANQRNTLQRSGAAISGQNKKKTRLF